MHPDPDGGDTVTRYKIEWDTAASFDSNTGAALGTHTKILTDYATECVTSPCSYVVSSLEIGVEY